MSSLSAQPAQASAAKATAPPEPSTTEAPRPIPEAPAAAPSYPSSSRMGPKDWDKIGADEAADDDSGDVNLFFKKLFQSGTPDQQRAMMKSFTESNGTTLSTDWDDVKGRTVETKPPKGVEAKKWA